MNYLRTMADLENYYYGRTSEILKADSVLSTGDAYVYNMVYGKKVWLQMSTEMNAFAVLPKTPWDNTGFRIFKTYLSAASGVSETGDVPNAANYSGQILEVGSDVMKPHILAHAFEVSEILDELSTRGDDIMGDPMNTLKEVAALQHIRDANTQLCRTLNDFDTKSVDPNGATFYDFDSLDHVISSYSESTLLDNTDYANIYGITRNTAANSWADAIVDHNSGVNRPLTLEILDDAFKNVWLAGGSPKVILTGYDTQMALSQLLEANRRYTMPVGNVVPTYNGIRGPISGTEGGFRVAF